MNLSNYEYGLLFTFKTCADLKSFSQASKILQVKQPAISYSIKKLENILETKLFDRGAYGIKLTNDGKVLYDYITKADNNIHSGLNVLMEMKKKHITELKVGISLDIAVVYMPNVLQEFKKLFPNVKVIISTKNENTLLSTLQKKELDLVIYVSAINKRMPGITIKKINNNEIVCVGIKKFKDQIENHNNLQKLIIPTIFPESSTNLFKEVLNKLNETNVEFDNIIEANSSIMAKELLISGLGIGFINKASIINEINNNELYILNMNMEEVIYSINVAMQDKNNNAVIKEFINIFKKKVLEKNDKNNNMQ